MADNVYLLETRLSAEQQLALEAIRSVAREQGLTVFLVGGAVRDLMSGSPVRDLDFAIQGNALKLRTELERTGASFSGVSIPLQSVYVRFPKGVRVELGSTLSVTYPKPGRPIYQAATILEDLRRRDFTANAMALSLNEGSYGLLMDPLNGIADIENRELRLVNNYGFIEDPVRLIRAARFMARLGWQMDDRTRSRYETAKEESYIDALQPVDRGYEVEELFHEEEPLRVMRRLEEEGWLKHLSSVLSISKVNAPELARLRETQMQLETRGIRADAAAANFPLLTGKIVPAEVESMKKSFPRTAFVAEIDGLESAAKDLGTQLSSKAMTLPSEAYKLILRSDPVAVLWTIHSAKSSSVQAKLRSFLTDWPQAQQKLPILLMAEMRITPEIPGYSELQETLFYALMDGRLTTPEELKAFLEPYSPPAPPPPVSLRRPRAPRKEAKAGKSRKKAAVGTANQESQDPVEGQKQELPAVSSPAPTLERQAGKKLVKTEGKAEGGPPVVPKLVAKEQRIGGPAPERKKAATASPTKPLPAKPVKAVSRSKVKASSAKSHPSRAARKPSSVTGAKATKPKTKAPSVQPKKNSAQKSQKEAVRKATPAKKAPSKPVVKKRLGAKKATVKKGSAKRR